MRYRWILFDADGVLFDYDAAERSAFSDVWHVTGRPEPADALATYQRINTELWREFERGRLTQDRLREQRFEMLLSALGIDADPQAMADRFVFALGQCGHLLPGALDLLRSLHGRIGMVLLTNGIAEVQRSRLARSGIGDLLTSIVISGEVGAAKPDPRIFDHAFESVGKPAKRDVLMVGDSLSSDILGGARYGVDTCWVNPRRLASDGEVEPTFQVERVGDLPAILGALDDSR